MVVVLVSLFFFYLFFKKKNSIAPSSLLAAIQAGTTLRKTETVEHEPAFDEDAGGVLGMIAKALLDRREAIKVNEREDDSDDDDWL